jgi:hypothetical protein
MTGRDQAFLRGQLASVGILLDPPTPAAAPPPAKQAPSSVDRDEVRTILVAAGAPAHELEWLVASCPSVEDARGYRPPPRLAWCIDCGDIRPCDDDGCFVCRGGQ